MLVESTQSGCAQGHHAGQIALVAELLLARLLHGGYAVRSLELPIELLQEGNDIGALQHLHTGGGKFVQDLLERLLE